MKRIAIMGSPDKPDAQDTLDRLVHWSRGRADVVFAELSYDSERAKADHPDMLFVLGGDGTIISAVHGMGVDQIPIVGVNLGKLGFFADFTIDGIESEGEFLFSGELPVTRRVLLDVVLKPRRGSESRMLAVNDCVIHAGPPFRIIELGVRSASDQVVRVRGDGLIVSSASGSTAHNLSAGGPILDPTSNAIILTPISPHALTYRPLVVDASRVITVRGTATNEETSVVVDGRSQGTFGDEDSVVITRWPADFMLVRNPRHSVWWALRRKLRWGAGNVPRVALRRERGNRAGGR